VRLARRGAGFAPIAGVAAAADLMALAKLEADAMYRTWQVVSLARVESDGLIEVRTRDGLKILFSTTGDYLRQLARLDLLVAAAKEDPLRPLREINLALGSQVPVRFGTAAPALAFPAFTSAPPHPSL
jgi:cell division protein FtsQ